MSDCFENVDNKPLNTEAYCAKCTQERGGWLYLFRFLLVLIFLSASYITFAQENIGAIENQILIEDQSGETTERDDASGEDDHAAALGSQERRQIEMEIRTSTLNELAVWCRRLGLSESGTKTELQNRLRNHFGLREPQARQNADRRVITIDSAHTTEYFSVAAIGEDYVRLTGEVSLTLRDGSATHRICAEEILFNRTRNIITARGTVLYEKNEDNTTESFRGENITVNIDTWSSIFLDGLSTIEDDGSSYLFSGTVISRTDESVTILTNASITNAANPEALWSISASRLWLLPGSDFAILNAVLNVGEIPIFYFPFLYVPADILFFHPVVGYRSREGGFVQTTSYILGQPQADKSDSSSLSRIIGNSNDSERELQGLFLRTTGRKVSDPNALRLKALADYYVNLGGYLGIELNVPKTGILNPLSLSLGLGFTRTVYNRSGGYTPYSNVDNSSDWNSSNLFSMSVPFRYRMTLQSSISMPIANFSWSIPFFSDPYVNRDFLDRAESMDLVNMMQQNTADTTLTTEHDIGNYQWHITGNISPSFPDLAPYISRMTITTLSTTLTFNRIRDSSITNNDSPGRFFYAPDRYTIYNFSGTLSGTPLTLGERTGSGSTDDEDEYDDPFDNHTRPVPPWEENQETAPRQQRNSRSERASAETLSPPALNVNFSLPRIGETQFKIDYQLTPTSASEMQFMNSGWRSYDQVDWTDIQSILTIFGGSTQINLHLDHGSSIFTNVLTFAGSGTWRDYTYLNKEADIFTTNGDFDESKLENARRTQYSQTNYTSSYSYSGTFRPFTSSDMFTQSNLQYSFRGTLVRSRRYTDGAGPELAPVWGTWAKEEKTSAVDTPGLSLHRLSANMQANILNMDQRITISTDLPPLDWQISANASFRIWISETSINFRITKPTTGENEGEWVFEPVNLTETLRFSGIGSFNYNMVINPRDNIGITTIRSSLTLWTFKSEFTAIRTQKSVFNFNDPDNTELGGGWALIGEPELFPKDLSFSYSHSFANMNIISNFLKLSFNVNTSLNFDLQQHTNSNFQLSLGFTVSVTNFMEIRMSATSNNSVIFRYFKGIPGMEDYTSMYIDGPQNNIFTDLLDSFNFFDEAARRRSGFKMQRLNLTAVHHLGDWSAELRVDMYPYRNTAAASPVFQITSDVSFLVKWRPITEIKSDITYDGRTERWTFR